MPRPDSPRPVPTVGRSRPAGRPGGGVAAVIGLLCALAGCGPAAAPPAETASEVPPPTAASTLVPDPARMAAATPDLLAHLDRDAFSYFRFLNAPWAQRVCEAFDGQLAGVPTARLHGDAHVEQYALTGTARGLDDFDDSAFGPVVIDLVRFLGSIDLATRTRGWQASGTWLVDQFLEGYRHGLADPGYLPPEPAIVRRLRASASPDKKGFLAGAEALMVPMVDGEPPRVSASLQRVEALVRKVRPDMPRGYLKVKKVGWLRIGIGSALSPKALARVEGPGPGDADDVILEAKQLSDLRGVSCMTVPESGEVLRVVSGTEQLGRIQHGVLAVVPRPSPIGDARDWWVRSWDPTYREVNLPDYLSVEELAETVHDAGAQLGAGGLRATGDSVERENREAERAAIVRMEPKIRQVARQLAEELAGQWAAFKNTRTAAPALRP